MNKNSRSTKIWIIVFLLPTAAVFCLLFAIPLGTTVVSSFTKWNGMEPMQFTGLDNYIRIFQSEDFIVALKNTLIWALAAAFIHVPFGVLVALVLNRKRRGWKFTRASFMIPNMISKTALALMFTFVFKPDVGILNSFLRALGLDHLTHNWLQETSTALFSITNIWLWYAALVTLITFAELTSISPELAESARIDGATEFQIDVKIYLPLLKRIIGTGVVISVVGVFKEFETIFITTNGGPGNATTNLAMMMYNRIMNSSQYGYANALGVLLLILSIGVMFLCNKIFSMDKED